MDNPDSQAKSIVPVPVLPLVSPEKAAEQWALFEALKAKLLSGEDYQTIAGKRFIKRSGFRKIAVYFGISDRLVREERADRNDNSFSWRLVVEAFAPNGRSCIGVGACDSKERKFAHTEHDVYATAHTRAKSRAISDLVAGGVVSAEEVSATDVENASDETVEPPRPSENVTNHSQQETTLKQESTPKVPCVKDVIKLEGLRQFPLTDGLKAAGMLNVLEDEISIVPEKPLKLDGPTIAGFLIPRVLDPMCAKHEITYTITKTENGDLSYILITGKLSDEQIKNLQVSSRWSFAKALEKTEQNTKEKA
jgi:hypothetical protein